ncbi:MAG: hypothetical protein ABW087_18150 [Candidatus Thiodiazotropha sp.]
MDKLQFIATVLGVISAIVGIIVVIINKRHRWIGVIGLSLAMIFGGIAVLIPSNIQFIEPPKDTEIIHSKLDDNGQCITDIKTKIPPFSKIDANEYIIILFKLKSGSKYWLPSFPISKNGVINNIAYFKSVPIGLPNDKITTYEISVGITRKKYHTLVGFDEMPNTFIQHDRVIVSRICE